MTVARRRRKLHAGVAVVIRRGELADNHRINCVDEALPRLPHAVFYNCISHGSNIEDGDGKGEIEDASGGILSHRHDCGSVGLWRWRQLHRKETVVESQLHSRPPPRHRHRHMERILTHAHICAYVADIQLSKLSGAHPIRSSVVDAFATTSFED